MNEKDRGSGREGDEEKEIRRYSGTDRYRRGIEYERDRERVGTV